MVMARTTSALRSRSGQTTTYAACSSCTVSCLLNGADHAAQMFSQAAGVHAQVLARHGHALDRLLAQHAAKGQDGVAAQVLLWRDHSELRDAVQNIFI